MPTLNFHSNPWAHSITTLGVSNHIYPAGGALVLHTAVWRAQQVTTPFTLCVYNCVSLCIIQAYISVLEIYLIVQRNLFVLYKTHISIINPSLQDHLFFPLQLSLPRFITVVYVLCSQHCKNSMKLLTVIIIKSLISQRLR